MPNLEEIVYSDDDEDGGAEADMTNLDTNIPVRLVLTTRIHKDHLVEQIIRDIHSTPQTIRMTKSVTDHGCVMWEVDLIDMRQYADSEGGGQELYIRVAASDLDTMEIVLSRNPNLIEVEENAAVEELKIDRKGKFRVLRVKHLGHGGFGSVYKDVLANGEVVAIKRLSRTSGQGIEELSNEVRLIKKLQHRNLVRLLGCCIEVQEKLLVYEYMEHKSLNTFIFGENMSSIRAWDETVNKLKLRLSSWKLKTLSI
nr:receptor-like serine/threonine-protein kinase SD1-8 isoform X2 [Tanacetum cinerariifolium]